MATLFMPKKDARTGKIIRGPTVPRKSVDVTNLKARQLDRQADQLAEEYERRGNPVLTILHSNAALTQADKGVVAQAITIIDDALNAFNDLPAGHVESTGRDGVLARLEKTRDALYSVLRGFNFARLPKTALLIVFEMMATDEPMVYNLFGKRPQYTLALVCKAWHDTILECPAMWCKINIRNIGPERRSIKVFRFSGGLFKAFEEVVSRSKRQELCLNISVPDLAPDGTITNKTNGPGQAYWAKKHVFLLVKQASRWAKVKISCVPSLMACLCVLRPSLLRNLSHLSLGLKPIPGEVYEKVYTVQGITKALDPKRCKIVLQGFEVLSRKDNLITDEKRRFLTVQDGALLDSFDLPSLRTVTINSKLSSKTVGLIADSTFISVAVLLTHSKCTTKITMLTLTNPVFSETLLDLLHSLTNLAELQGPSLAVRMN
ncbi:hypothetical protein BDZ89DRAFT_667720 [Hymenopellis radicata]|nr:hypothetical protein BDZ89DRAFT_667720 [Hymenopellis radicata]